MTFLRAIRDDLVEKRLWPVALVLALAMVAAPVLLSRSAGADSASSAENASPMSAPRSDLGAHPVVLRQTTTAPAIKRRFHDPFRHGAAPIADTATSGGSAQAVTVTPSSGGSGGSSGSSSGTSSGSSGGSGSGDGSATTVTTTTPSTPTTPSTTTTPSTPTTPSVPYDATAAGYRVDIRWGDSSSPQSHTDVTRLAPLNVGTTPEVLLLGVRRGGKTAVFFIPGKAGASGDGRCRPTTGLCHLVELRAGDTEYVDVPTGNGIAQYELSVTRVAPRHGATAAQATSLRTRSSRTGRALLRAAIKSGRSYVTHYSYDAGDGVLDFMPHLAVAPSAG